jgi:hypothetical protein
MGKRTEISEGDRAMLTEIEGVMYRYGYTPGAARFEDVDSGSITSRVFSFHASQTTEVRPVRWEDGE